MGVGSNFAAMGRQPHYPPLSERFAASPAAPENPTPVQAMAHKLKTPAGRTLYALKDTGTGVRHHQIGARIPSIFNARARKRAWRVESRDHVLEFEANVHPRSHLSNGLNRLAPKEHALRRVGRIHSNPPKIRSRSIQAAKSKNDAESQS